MEKTHECALSPCKYCLSLQVFYSRDIQVYRLSLLVEGGGRLWFWYGKGVWMLSVVNNSDDLSFVDNLPMTSCNFCVAALCKSRSLT